jgi:hypothetical protein
LGACRGERHNYAEQDPNRSGHRGPERQNPPVGRHVRSNRTGDGRGQAEEKPCAPNCRNQSQGAADSREHQILRYELAQNAAPACADGEPYAEFPGSPQRPCQQQVDDVRARDGEHQRRDCLQEPAELARAWHAAESRVGLPVGREREAASVARLGGFEAAGDDFRFRLQLGHRRVRREAAEHSKPGLSPIRQAVADPDLHAPCDGRPELMGEQAVRLRHVSRRDADNHEFMVVEANGAAQRARIPAEARPPKLIAQDQRRRLARRRVLARQEGAPDLRAHAEDIEVVGRDHHSPNLLVLSRAAGSRHAQRDGHGPGKHGEGRKGLALGLEVAVVAIGGVAEAVLVNADEAIGLGRGKRAQEQAVQNAEDGGVQANAKRDRQDQDGGEARGFPQHPQRKAKILRQSFDHGPAPHGAGVLANQGGAAERAEGGVAGVVRREPRGPLFLGFEIEVRAKLAVEIVLMSPSPPLHAVSMPPMVDSLPSAAPVG